LVDTSRFPRLSATSGINLWKFHVRLMCEVSNAHPASNHVNWAYPTQPLTSLRCRRNQVSLSSTSVWGGNKTYGCGCPVWWIDTPTRWSAAIGTAVPFCVPADHIIMQSRPYICFIGSILVELLNNAWMTERMMWLFVFISSYIYAHPLCIIEVWGQAYLCRCLSKSKSKLTCF